ncbi:MAG TPA: tRNA lysidine(34) synthetase TilS [Candidatus Acidoferrales bacterium]|nr:tRNA lysidine(34) synthetase TilS [Candidatus Acidoferrales bacterium]
MRTPLEQAVLNNIRNARMIVPGDRIGVAVSGGADSVALLRILEDLQSDLGIILSVVHVDHMLRGEVSTSDAQFVADLAHDSGLEIVATREDVAAEAARHGWNLEDAARRLRYAFFERVCAEGQTTRIAVAHTAQDQAETVLAHLIRGTGPAGLAGIYPTAGFVIRPLLRTDRQDLRDYLRAKNQAWREDATNRDTRRLRARIREQLLPVLERDFTTAIVAHLGELARLSGEQEAFWSAIVEDRYHNFARVAGDAVTIQVRDLLMPFEISATHTPAPSVISSETAPLRALTERLIRRLYEGVRGDRKDLLAQHVEQVIHLATESASGSRLELPGNIIVERVFGKLTFSLLDSSCRSLTAYETDARANTYQYAVSLPNTGAAVVSIPELGSCFRLKVIDWTLQPSDTKSDGEALDASLLRGSLILRNWRPGDAYRPFGRHQARKLKQMFLADRIPLRDRARWPVLECGGQVVWTRGMAPADDFCARPRTQVGVLIEESRL